MTLFKLQNAITCDTPIYCSFKAKQNSPRMIAEVCYTSFMTHTIQGANKNIYRKIQFQDTYVCSFGYISYFLFLKSENGDNFYIRDELLEAYTEKVTVLKTI